MTDPEPGEVAYRALQREARTTGRTTQELLGLYALEGVLARLSRSPLRDRFVLKGGVLLAAFGNRRPTKDVDLAALAISNDVDSILEMMRDILTSETVVGDGLKIDRKSLSAGVIRDEDEYSGVRVSATATLNTARLSFRIDVNVGDPIYPEPANITVPRLLGGEPIALRGYPLHMVLAEKLVTAVQRGTVSTRWRDFGDIWTLTRHHPVDGSDLQNAVSAVAQHRRAVMIPLPQALAGYAEIGQPRWATWRRRTGNQWLPEGFADVVTAVISFGEPVLAQIVSGLSWSPNTGTWELHGEAIRRRETRS